MLTQTERQQIAAAFRIPESEDAKIEEIADYWRATYGAINFRAGIRYLWLTPEQAANLKWVSVGYSTKELLEAESADAIGSAGPIHRKEALGIISSDTINQTTMAEQTDFTVDNTRALRVANDKMERMHPELKLGCIQAAQKFSNSMDELLQNADRLFHFVAPTPEAFLKYAG